MVNKESVHGLGMTMLGIIGGTLTPSQPPWPSVPPRPSNPNKDYSRP